MATPRCKMGTSDQALTTRNVPTPSRESEAQENGSSSHPSDPQRYDFYWNHIRRLAPDAILLRGPSHLNPVQAVGDGDLDILLTTSHTVIEDFLVKQGFCRAYKPQAYLKRFQLLRRDVSTPYTIELYSSEHLGLKFVAILATQRG